jgi:hypothetical protein
MSALSLTVGARFKHNTFKQQTVGASSAQMTQLAISDAVKTPEQIFVQALPGNTGTITISNVNPAVSLGAGIVLSAGQNTVLPSHTPSEWYVIASGAGQILNILYSSGAE